MYIYAMSCSCMVLAGGFKKHNRIGAHLAHEAHGGTLQDQRTLQHTKPVGPLRVSKRGMCVLEPLAMPKASTVPEGKDTARHQ